MTDPDPSRFDPLSGGDPVLVIGRRADLDVHLERLRPEFNGAPRICFELASLIVRIRRELDLDTDMVVFHEILERDGEFLLDHLSARWLISICDTYSDDPSDPLRRSNALLVSSFFNLIKLADSESEVLGARRRPTDEEVESYKGRHPVELWDGITSYSILGGDMPLNLFRRVRAILAPTPLLLAIFDRLYRGAGGRNTLLARLQNLNTAYPFDADSVAAPTAPPPFYHRSDS